MRPHFVITYLGIIDNSALFLISLHELFCFAMYLSMPSVKQCIKCFHLHAVCSLQLIHDTSTQISLIELSHHKQNKVG